MSANRIATLIRRDSEELSNQTARRSGDCSTAAISARIAERKSPSAWLQQRTNGATRRPLFHARSIFRFVADSLWPAQQLGLAAGRQRSPLLNVEPCSAGRTRWPGVSTATAVGPRTCPTVASRIGTFSPWSSPARTSRHLRRASRLRVVLTVCLRSNRGGTFAKFRDSEAISSSWNSEMKAKKKNKKKPTQKTKKLRSGRREIEENGRGTWGP